MIEPYNWMISGDTEKKLEVMAKVRKDIDGLPETALTYRPEYGHDGVSPHFPQEVLKLYGFWEMTHSNRGQWVNPRHDSAYLHSDVITECECGARLIHEDERHVDGQFNNHTDNCRIEWRRAAESELWSRRREVMREAAVRLVPQRILAHRLAVADRSAVYRVNERLEIDMERLNEIGHKKKWATWVYLRDHGYSNIEIAEAFGVAPNTISGGAKKAEERDEVEFPWRREEKKLGSATPPDWLGGEADD